MRFVVLPQAIKNILPALGNEFVTVIKESSIVSVIGLADLMFRTNDVIALTFKSLACLAIAALCGVILNAILPGNDYVFGVSVEGDKSADLGSY